MKFTRTTTITKIERKIFRAQTVSRPTNSPVEADGEPPDLADASLTPKQLGDGEASLAEEE